MDAMGGKKLPSSLRQQLHYRGARHQRVMNIRAKKNILPIGSEKIIYLKVTFGSRKKNLL